MPWTHPPTIPTRVVCSRLPRASACAMRCVRRRGRSVALTIVAQQDLLLALWREEDDAVDVREQPQQLPGDAGRQLGSSLQPLDGGGAHGNVLVDAEHGLQAARSIARAAYRYLCRSLPVVNWREWWRWDGTEPMGVAIVERLIEW